MSTFYFKPTKEANELMNLFSLFTPQVNTPQQIQYE